MAVQVQGAGGTVVEADATFKASRASLRPNEAINWNSVFGASGALTGVAAAGPVFSFRNTGANPNLIRRIHASYIVTTAFTMGQGLCFSALKAIGFSASDTGGTALYTAGQNKLRTSFTNIASAPDIRIATTAALTAGTRTLETVALGSINGNAGSLGVNGGNLVYEFLPGDYPLTLAQNEGFIVTNDFAMGAAGVIRLVGGVTFAEVTAY